MTREFNTKDQNKQISRTLSKEVPKVRTSCGRLHPSGPCWEMLGMGPYRGKAAGIFMAFHGSKNTWIDISETLWQKGPLRSIIPTKS